MPYEKFDKKSLINVFGGASSLIIKYKDIFDLGEFYTALLNWLDDYDWHDCIEDELAERAESYMGQVVDKGGGREVWFRWRLKKTPADSSKIDFFMDMNFHGLGLKSTEVVKAGKKIKADKGELEITIKASVHLKYMAELDKDSLLKYLKDLFTKKAYDPAQYVKELYQEVYAFQNFIKQWFKMKRYLPYEESKSFYPSYAWPSHLKD
jgi:hypothetical protein